MNYFKIVISILFIAIIATAGCSQNNDDGENISIGVYRNIARKTTSDGWVYSFIYEHYKDPSLDDSTLMKYQFNGINLRYAYMEGYEDKLTITRKDGSSAIRSYSPGVVIWGKRDDQLEDRKKLDDLLLNATKDQLLKLTAGDLSLKTIDSNMVIQLIQEALLDEPQKEGTLQSYWDKPQYAMLQEQSASDNYKFQIAFLQDTGCVDELFIDVLFCRDDGSYIQLSDMIDQGRADPEQIALYNKIRNIVSDIKDRELFVTENDTYKNDTIGGVDLKRLYMFLKDIHENKFDKHATPSVFLREQTI